MSSSTSMLQYYIYSQFILNEFNRDLRVTETIIIIKKTNHDNNYKHIFVVLDFIIITL